MVDRTVYAADAVPELPLRQILGRQEGKQTIKTLMPDHTQLGADQPAQELALTSLAAGKTCSTMQDHLAARRTKRWKKILFSVQRLHGFRQVVQHVQLHVAN